mmetsp:Transcript_22700/g.52963  ORF Transcript_22700/g.52963 Transcript_22700/m.52963 type:complete len:142 (-) Transcript_22700:245-670(-)
MSWSTGLLAIFDDYEIYSHATNCCGVGLLVMPVRVGLEVFDGGPTCPVPVDLMVSLFQRAGCHERDVALTLNAILFGICPCVRIYWRKKLRNYYSIDGSVLGDCFAATCCFPCAVCQESREVKRRGGNYLAVPEQLTMTSR